jgi:integral membrane protein (TIGR01906 family)
MGYAAALCVLLMVLAQSVFIPTFCMPFFRWQYDMRNVPETIGIEKDELMWVTSELLGYMRGRRPDLNIYATVNGQYRAFFAEREIVHMVDVLELYNIGHVIRNAAFWMFLLLLLAMAFFKMPILEVLALCCREVMAGLLIITGILAGLIAWRFDRAFEIFHLLFFNNDYWILNPGEHLLIQMVPQGFFVHISIFVGLLLLLFSAAIIGAGTWYLRSCVLPFRR